MIRAVINPTTIQLRNIMDDINLVQHVSVATHIAGHTLDCVITRNSDIATDDDVRVGVIGQGGLLRAFFFSRPIRGSGHV